MARTTLLVPLALLALVVDEPPDARGWRPRAGPPDPTALAAPATPQPVALPPTVAGRISRRTILAYLSPDCPHCLHAMPEIVALARRTADVADTLCVMSGHAGRGEVESFTAQWNPPFPVIHDADQAFARATGLDSTPSLLVVDPPPRGAQEALATEAWLPFVRGAGVVLEMRIRGDPMAVLRRGEPTGVMACSTCHAEETRAWSITAHGSAYYAVVRKKRADDLSCLECHVTVLDRTAGQDAGVLGFRPGDHRSPFADVGCESCHTPSGPHDGDGGDPRASCARCHDAGHGRFDPVEGLVLIDHFQAMGWTDDALRERRLAVAQGQVPRPLADLPPGATAGADACARCHRDQARQWRKTPHAGAMDALQGPDREQGACVACHATPREPLPATPGPDAFRTAESVGCEACHGPGTAHAADPSVGLTTLRSPDPECAVERVCTRCHTPERDADWSLGAALPLVVH